MKTAYTISHKIPRGVTNFTPQGLRDIYESSNVSKRSRQYEVQIETTSPRNQGDFENQLHKSTVKAVKEIFSMPHSQWVADNYFALTRLRTLFLYDRDNTGLWTEIQEIFMEWVHGLLQETRGVNFDLLLPTVEFVHRNVGFKIKRLYDYLYWFNPIVKKMYGARNVLEHLESLYFANYISQDSIMDPVKQSLLSLHRQHYSGAGFADFRGYFGFVRSICKDTKFLDDFLEAVAASSLQTLAAGDLQELMNKYAEWKTAEVGFWEQVSSEKHPQEDAELLFKKLETCLHEMILTEYRGDLISLLVNTPQVFEKYTKQVTRVGLGVKFQQICKQLVYEYNDRINGLQAGPLVKATLLCDFAETTLRGPVGETRVFSACWLDYIFQNKQLGKILAHAAAYYMAKQDFSHVTTISAILKLDTSVMDDELSPFLETFSEFLWRYTCELAPRHTEGGMNRFVHGINILRADAPEVVWHTSQYIRLIETQPVLNHEYWPREVTATFNTEETLQLTRTYQQQHPNRIVEWDMGQTFTEVQLNNRRIECTYAAYQVLQSLLSAPGYSLCIGDLKIPEKLQDATLKELISQEYVLYVPSTREKKFNNHDLIYLTYKLNT